MSLPAIVDAIQTVNATLPSVVKAPLGMEYPAALNPELDCPFAFTWPAVGDWGVVGLRLAETRQVFDVVILVAPVASGLRGPVLTQAITIAEELRETYLLSDLHLDLGGTVEEVESFRFSGLREIIRYAGVEFYGLRLELTARLKEAYV